MLNIEVTNINEVVFQNKLPAEIFYLSNDTIQQIQQKFKDNPDITKTVLEDTLSIDSRKNKFGEYKEEGWNEKELVSVKDFLLKTDLVEKNKQHLKKVWDKEWTEHLEWSGNDEIVFLEKIKSIIPNQQVEVMQISIFTKGKIVNQSNAIGSGEYIQKDELDKAVSQLNLPETNPDEIYFVHNHFDEYEKLRIPLNYEQKDGLATVGGLSKSDIDFVDKFKIEKVKDNTKVFIIAINERGLTFSYEAGSSKYRDWENNP